MVRAIYTGYGETYWLHMAQQFSENHDWQPVYWVADPQVQTNVERDYPGTIFHSVFDAIKGIPHPST